MTRRPASSHRSSRPARTTSGQGESRRSVDVSLAQILKNLVGRGDLADCVEVRAAFPFDPRLVPQNRDLFNLFDTTPDLSGADIDIGPFIRDGADLDVLAFWRDETSGLGPGEMWKTGQRAGCPFKKLLPAREELCPVAAWRFRKFFEALPGEHKKCVWARDWRKGWVKLTDPDRVYAGQLFLLHNEVGGYDAQVGWTGDPNTIPELCMLPAPTPSLQPPPEEASASGESALDDEDNAVADWQSVHDHSVDVARELNSILNDIPIVSALEATGLTAPLKYTPPWHDAGKAHGKFPAKLTREARGQWNRSEGDHPAKAPKAAWKSFFHEREDADEAEHQFIRRPGFRHELASALALLETLRLARSGHAALTIADELRAALGTPEKGSAASEAQQDAARTALGHIVDLDRVGFNLLLYLVACHHGKVRLGLRSTEEDYDPDQRDPVPETEERLVRRCHGVQDGDAVPACRVPAADAPADFRSAATTPPLTLSLDPMEAFSVSYGASWADRMRELLEVVGPFRLGYLEALIRAADQRASANPTGVSPASSGDPGET